MGKDTLPIASKDISRIDKGRQIQGEEYNILIFLFRFRTEMLSSNLFSAVNPATRGMSQQRSIVNEMYRASIFLGQTAVAKMDGIS